VSGALGSGCSTRHLASLTLSITRRSLRLGSKSLSRSARPAWPAAGFCMLGPPLPSKPSVHRPPGFRSAAAVKRALDRQRPSAARRGYGPRWRRARAAFLAQHPLCAVCEGRGLVIAATVVDHVVPHRGDERLFWDEGNWAPSCKPCSRREDRARGPLGLTRPTRGGVILLTRKANGDRPGRRAFMPAKLRRGVCGRSLAEPLNSGP
jgi:5-methylcytosine-specific restriction protein A